MIIFPEEVLRSIKFQDTQLSLQISVLEPSMLEIYVCIQLFINTYLFIYLNT